MTLKSKRNEKNKDVIWAQVSRQNKSSQFISRLVTRRENATFTEKPIIKKDSTHGDRNFYVLTMVELCHISVQVANPLKDEYTEMQ